MEVKYVNKRPMCCGAQMAYSEGMFGVGVFWEGKRSGNISRREFFGKCLLAWGTCGGILQGNYVQDYKSLCVAVMIWLTQIW